MIALLPIFARTRPPEAPRMDLLPLLPPQNLEAENAVLGCMIMEHHVAVDCVAALRVEDFYGSKQRTVFEAVRGLLEDGSPIAVLTVLEELARRKTLDAVGGRPYLVHLATEAAPSTVSVEVYIGLVRSAALRRSLISAGTALARACYDPSTDPAALLDRAQADFVAAIDRGGEVSRAPLWKLVDAEVARMRAHVIVPSESTGYGKLDTQLGGGLRAGELIVLAARPGVGKTSLATALSRNVASRRVPVAFFSLEMPKETITQNLIAQAARTNTYQVRSDRLPDEEIERIAAACEPLRHHPLHIIESSDMNLFAIATEARRMKMREGLGLIVVDYLQLVETHGKAESRNVEVGQISRGLKKLALRLKVPVVALCQMSRDQEKSGRTRPQLSDLRDSGSIEQDADVVMFLVRTGYGKPEGSDENGKTEVIVAKNRNGPMGEVFLRFHKESVSFSEWRMS